MKFAPVDNRPGEWLFDCPGCGYMHGVWTQHPDGDPAGPKWQFNGNVERPTVTPSLFVHGQYECHSFITDGRIQFLSDCTHRLAGQTVEIPDFRTTQ